MIIISKSKTIMPSDKIVERSVSDRAIHVDHADAYHMP